jgi:hypothetical protein
MGPLELALRGSGSWWQRVARRCEQEQNEAWSLADDLNIYNILEECHYEPAPPSVLSDRRKRLAAVRRAHRTWPVRPVVRFNQTVHNWATLLGSNPPCVLSV